MTAYYNEFDPYAAQWLRNLIAASPVHNEPAALNRDRQLAAEKGAPLERNIMDIAGPYFPPLLVPIMNVTHTHEYPVVQIEPIPAFGKQPPDVAR